MTVMMTSLWREIRAMVPVYLANYLAGIHYSWTSANLRILRSKPFSYSDDEISLVTSVLHLGRLISPFVAMFFTSNFGRKNHLIAAALMALVSHIILVTWKSIPVLLLVRFIFGFHIGIVDSSSNMYMGEVLSKRFRGMLCSSVYICFSFGTTSAFLLGIYCTYDDISLILMVLSIMFFISTLYAVETPYFLLMRGDTENAVKNLAWLRNHDSKQAERELAEICKSAENNIKFSALLENCKKPEVYKSCCVLLPLGIINSLISLISYYANVVLPTSELLSSEHFAVLFSLLTMLVTCVCSQLVDRCGRRALVIPGFFLLTIAFACIAIFFYLQDQHVIHIPYFPWVIFILITASYLWYQLSANVPVGIVRTEMYPSNFKNIGISLNIICNGLTNFLSAFLFLLIVHHYGIYLNFFILCFSSIVALIIAYFLLPETKNKTLSEIQTALRI